MPDQISYADAPAGVHVDLANGRATRRRRRHARAGGQGRASGDGVRRRARQWRVLRRRLVGGAGDDVLRGGPGATTSRPTARPAGAGRAPYDDRVYGGPGGDGIYLGNGDDGPGAAAVTTPLARLRAWPTCAPASATTTWRPGCGSRPARASTAGRASGRDLRLVGDVGRPPAARRRVGRIDLGTGVFAMRLGARTHESTLRSVERLRIPDGRWTVIGTAADEMFFGGDLRRDAIVVRARGGDDMVSGTAGRRRARRRRGPRQGASTAARADVVRGFEVVRR